MEGDAPVLPGSAATPNETTTPRVDQEMLPVTNSQISEETPFAQPMPRQPVLQRVFSVASSLYRIRWSVDAKKLKSTDREAVSPAFELNFSVPVQFKMVIRPKVTCNARGGASFKKAKGKGSVEVRCLGEIDPSVNSCVTFRISLGGGKDSGSSEAPRGPVRHNFAEHTICGLPEGQDEWDFSKAIDESSQAFVVCLEILSGNTANI